MTACGGPGSRQALYAGGTIPDLGAWTEGVLDTTSEIEIAFRNPRAELAAIPYSSIVWLEYGREASWRGAGGSVAAKPVGMWPFGLSSGRGRHFLMIVYTDTHGEEQAAMFELGRDIVRSTVSALEARSGKQVLYRDEAARKQFEATR